MDTSETAQSKSPSRNCAAANVKTSTDSQVEETRQAETKRDEPRDAEQVGQHDQQEAETDSEPETEEVCGYRVHPAAAVFPPYTDGELQDLADDIAKNGQRQDIVQHPDGSILDGRQPPACLCDGRS